MGETDSVNGDVSQGYTNNDGDESEVAKRAINYNKRRAL